MLLSLGKSGLKGALAVQCACRALEAWLPETVQYLL